MKRNTRKTNASTNIMTGATTVRLLINAAIVRVSFFGQRLFKLTRHNNRHNKSFQASFNFILTNIFLLFGSRQD
jgi:hypothetical protein